MPVERRVAREDLRASPAGPLSESWFVLDTGASSPEFNMGLDESLLLSVNNLGRPVLRFYAWSSPTVTFGYSQHYAEVQILTPLRPLIRRPTGGGIVSHERDWTYSLVFPAGHWWTAQTARMSYERLHRWLQRAFSSLNVPTELARSRRMETPGCCFAGAERHDLLHQGRKIAGAAQRRNRSGLLIQGSVQAVPRGVARDSWQISMQRAGAQFWAVRWETLVLGEDVARLALELARSKYGSTAHNRSR